MTSTYPQQPKAPALPTITPDPITESHKQSHETMIHPQSTDNNHKINFRAHLRIMIRRVEEPGQNVRDSAWWWSGC